MTRLRHTRHRLQKRAIRYCAVLAAIISVNGQPSTAREVVSLTNDLGILRDFSVITIGAADVKAARVFVDTDRFIVPHLPAAENTKLQQIAVRGLGANLAIVNTKEQANYLIQIRMEQYTNYALRNLRGEPSRGYVMISLCRFPLNESNCENLQYIYFKSYEPADIFSRVLSLWLEATVKADQ
jgi:hypothetical protein